jgi:hypothetical protein
VSTKDGQTHLADVDVQRGVQVQVQVDVNVNVDV